MPERLEGLLRVERGPARRDFKHPEDCSKQPKCSLKQPTQSLAYLKSENLNFRTFAHSQLQCTGAAAGPSEEGGHVVRPHAPEGGGGGAAQGGRGRPRLPCVALRCTSLVNFSFVW